MARITYVKKAQQRFAQKPVIDPATGQQKETPVMRNGVQRVNKHGRPTVLRVTENDLTKPLPAFDCGACRKPIEVGTPYKHISPKSGPYGGATLRRHADCPTWNVWDYSSSLSARTAQISHEGMGSIEGLDTPDEITDALSSIADEIRSLAEEKREGAQNIEDGFGHPTSMSEELTDIADQLDSWADEVEQADIPDLPEPEEADCEECDGTGEVENPDYDAEKAEGGENAQEDYSEEENISCEHCDGTGQHTPDEPTDDQMDEWRNEVQDAVSIVDECPV